MFKKNIFFWLLFCFNDGMSQENTRDISKERSNTLDILDLNLPIEIKNKLEDCRSIHFQSLECQEYKQYLSSKEAQELEKIVRIQEEKRFEEEKLIFEQQKLHLQEEKLVFEQQKLSSQENDFLQEEEEIFFPEKNFIRKEKDIFDTSLVVHVNKSMETMELEETSKNNYLDLGVEQNVVGSPVNRSQILTADMYIHALLETSINTRKDGEIILLVDRNVYSLEKKQFILIPQGTKILCSFQSLGADETSLSINCYRAYFPDGTSFLLTKVQGNDQMGRSGIIGDLDKRYLEKYGQIFIMSVLSGLATVGAATLPDSAMGSLGQYTALNIVDKTTDLLTNAPDLAPILSIPAGSRIILRSNIDINLNKVF